jgi:cell division protease FtsH
VKEVSIGKETISGKLTNGDAFRTNFIPDPQLTSRLREKGVSFQGEPEAQTSVWLILLYQSLPFLLILGIAFFIMRHLQVDPRNFTRPSQREWKELHCTGDPKSLQVRHRPA